MTKYRIKEVTFSSTGQTTYYLQYKLPFLWWMDMFCCSFTGSQKSFSTANEAEEYLKKHLEKPVIRYHDLRVEP